MDGFYLLKPDMLENKEALNYYLDFINSTDYLSLQDNYLIEDWSYISKILYEPNINNLSLDKLKELRKKMLVTIKGYDVFFKNKPAIISTISIKDDSKLQELFDFKKKLRKIFVYNTHDKQSIKPKNTRVKQQ